MPEFKDTPIAEIRKNNSKVVRVALAEISGHDLVSQRVFYDAGEGEMRPSKSEGFTLSIHKIGELIDALQKAKAEAERLGIIRPESEAA